MLLRAGLAGLVLAVLAGLCLSFVGLPDVLLVGPVTTDVIKAAGNARVLVGGSPDAADGAAHGHRNVGIPEGASNMRAACALIMHAGRRCELRICGISCTGAADMCGLRCGV